MGPDNPDDWTYGGFRPFITDWKADSQPYLVQVAQDDGSTTDAGTYSMKIDDFWTPMMSNSSYTYGAFTPAVGAGGQDLGAFADLSGTTVNSSSYLGGALTELSITNPDGSGYIVLSTPFWTNTLVNTDVPGNSADYIQFGNAAPLMVWDSTDTSSFPQVPDYVVPADPYAGIDFDPSDFLFGDIADA